MGYLGTITVNVTIENDVITAISVSGADDEPYFTDGKTVVPELIAARSTNIDTVSGAAYSSGGILDAIDSALVSALN